MLVASSVIFLVLLLYVMFAGYIPSKKRITSLEAELKQVYAREAALQTRITQQDQRLALRDQQLNALRTEREALSRRVEELEKELQLGAGRRR